MDIKRTGTCWWVGLSIVALGLAAAGCQVPPIRGRGPTAAATAGQGGPSPLAVAPISTGLPTITSLSPTAELAPSAPPSLGPTATPLPPTQRPSSSGTPSPSEKVPTFSHVIVIVLENREYGAVIGKTSDAPVINGWVGKSTLLTQFFAVTHPSLPNYIAMMAGDTLGIHSDCENCFVNAPSLPDLIEASGRSWRTYQEDMPSPCFIGSRGGYAQKHNPFVYFDLIRLNKDRCEHDVVPFDQMAADLASGSFPNFAFVVPNECNSGHSCDIGVADTWLGSTLDKIQSSPAFDANTLIVVTFDEGQGTHSCCGLGAEAGGRVATLLISPLVESGVQDATPYSHYSLLKTIAVSWGLTELGHAADPETSVIEAPWKAP